ncbi:MAG TPA: fasciclin domain-containing protein, partial [Bacteroidia bacterium]
DGVVGSANIVQADIEATNGYIHAIDKVLTPPAAKSTAKPKKPVTTAPKAPVTEPAKENTVSGARGSQTEEKVSGARGSQTEQKVTGARGGN